jgi:hypothetical protein
VENHTRSLISLGLGRARANNMRVNGPPKSGPLLCGGRDFLLSFYFLVAWLLSLEPYLIAIRI